MRNIKVNYLKYKIRIAILCWIISLFNLVQCIQLDTTQWQDVDITNDFINQNYIQEYYYGYSKFHDSLQLSQTQYVNLIRSFSSTGEILIQILDEYGKQQCSKTISVEQHFKYSLTNTNVEKEFFLAYASGNYKVFFGFLDETCNFSRGLSAPVQPIDFTSTSFDYILAKNGKDNVYVVSQTSTSINYLYLMILDISDTSTYSIKNHVKLGSTGIRWNLFSIQAFFDDYAVILARNVENKQQKITVDSDGIIEWGTPKNQGIFWDLNYNDNQIQNKAIQIENTNKYSIVTGDYIQDILTVYTFQYNGDGEIQDICLETYYNQMGNVGNNFFIALEFGVINQNFLWMKGDTQNDSYKSIIFFANPLDCQIYRNPDDSSIYQYKLENFGLSHIFHTYYSNQTVSLIACSSFIDGISGQNLQAIRINIGGCPKYCKICSDLYTCQSCITSDGERDVSNLCQCKDGYYQDTESDNCLECPQYCEVCSDSYTCQSCISSDGERNISNLCTCQDGYYQDTGSDNCLECPQYCSTCSNSTTCHTCIGPDGERDVSSLCKCKQGQYLDIENNNCLGNLQYSLYYSGRFLDQNLIIQGVL
ncbi:Insulin-like growth factor binding protein, N-terminal [Pseudocohnilembus persalinus]|uniref:Insulin-like growth factor binding protein, N-terminal n=1 Tax=Pseudocohnilembus persalinus TaxID=266149 RepID=A0A0V0R651_PSEPJ|nr:Insulin-like growth factor binding protein, N-terminal [Pseudocohnilembus persalinus]|eukprot:KRX09955.1 Insulin-like growth factor binding protein, N-terminal [Pseudocohnilembus persalinus]